MRKETVDKLWISSESFKKAVFTEEDGLPVLTEKAAIVTGIILLTLFLIISYWAG